MFESISEFFMGIWTFLNPYWVQLDTFMSQSLDLTLTYWYALIPILTFLLGRASKKAIINLPEKVVYRDKNVEVCSKDCINKQCVTKDIIKMYQSIDVGDADYSDHKEYLEYVDKCKELMDFCANHVKDIHAQALKGEGPSCNNRLSDD